MNFAMNTATPLMDAWKSTTSQYMEPTRKVNLLLVDQLAEMTDLQLKALESYGLIALGQLKKAAEVHDKDSAYSFNLAQADFCSNLAKKAMNDAREMARRNQELAREVTDILGESSSNWSPASVKKAS